MKRKDTACRFSVFMPADLVRSLDAMAKAQGHSNRSKVLADLVRAGLIEHESQTDEKEIAGTLTLVYDHHKRNLLSLLTDIQHEHSELNIATLHVHLDHHNCLEVLAMRGSAGDIRKISDRLIAAKGVKHGKLTITTAGKEHVA